MAVSLLVLQTNSPPVSPGCQMWRENTTKLKSNFLPNNFFQECYPEPAAISKGMAMMLSVIFTVFQNLKQKKNMRV